MIHGFQLFVQLILFISLHNWVLDTIFLSKLYCCSYNWDLKFASVFVSTGALLPYKEQ